MFESKKFKRNIPSDRIISLSILFGICQLLVVRGCSHIGSRPCEEITAEMISNCLDDGETLPNVNVSFPSVERYRELLSEPANYVRDDIEWEKNVDSQVGAENVVCRWRYVLDKDDNRIPKDIHQADCVDKETGYYTAVEGSDSPPVEYQCRRIYYPINVLKWNCKNSEIQWSFVQEIVSFGCGLEKIVS